MGRETFYQSGPADSTAWRTLVEVENASGELTEVGVGNMQARHAIKVNIDGEAVFNEVFELKVKAQANPEH